MVQLADTEKAFPLLESGSVERLSATLGESRSSWVGWVITTVQMHWLNFGRIVLDLRGRRRCVDSSEFEVASKVYGVEGAVGLPLECLDEAVKVHCKIVPVAFMGMTGYFYKKWFYFCLGSSWGKNNAALGLDIERTTLVRSLTTSSMFQGMPWSKWICRTRNCWIRYKSFLSSFGRQSLACGALNSSTKAEWSLSYSWGLCRRPCG